MSTFSTYMNYILYLNIVIQTLSSVCLRVDGANHIDRSRHWLFWGTKLYFFTGCSTVCDVLCGVDVVPNYSQPWEKFSVTARRRGMFLKVSRTIFDGTILVTLVRICCYQRICQTTIACSNIEINGSRFYSLLLFSQDSKRNVSQNGFSFLSRKCYTSCTCVCT